MREGSGQRRASLDAMELAPFPAEAWGTLSDWVGGRAISPSDLKGSVVLLCVYSDWYDPARRAWAMARRMATSKAKDGLIVVGVHHQEEWKAAAKDVPKDGNVYLAHDAKGGFRAALLSDQDPDFYIIDRAGQVRFADVETESVDRAVNQLLTESPEAAAGLKSKLAANAAAAEAEFRRSGAIREQVDLKNLPEIPFTEPNKAEYDAATWPKRVVNPDRVQAEAPPAAIQLPPTGLYLPKAPALKGRAIVIYVWNPDVRSSYESIMPMMDRLQQQHGRDVSIVGAAAFTSRDQYSQPFIDPKVAAGRLQQFTAARSFDHTLTLYQDGMAGPRESSANEQASFAVIAGSNGVIRWSGSPTSPGFRGALEQVIGADPGVRARRAAEETYIKASGR